MFEIAKQFKAFYLECKSQDFAFYMAAAYLIFSYLRPQAIYPWLDFLPWTQISILLGLAYLFSQKRIKVQSAHVLIFLFALSTLLSAIYSLYPEFSQERVDVVFIWFVQILFFTNSVQSNKQLKLLLILLFLILFKMSLFGARTWISRGFGFTGWGIAGPTGFFANSGEFSLLMAMLAVMSLAFLLGHKNTSKWYYLLPITAVMTVLGASSRGGQLALVGGILIVCIFILKVRFKTILVTLLTLFAIYWFTPEEQKERFMSMGEDGTSTSRLEYWAAGLEMLEEYPVTGIGHMAFPLYYADYYSYRKDDSTYLGRRQEVSHNSFVQVGSTLGWIGLITYSLMLVYCFLTNAKTRKLLMQQKEPNQEQVWEIFFSRGLDAATVAYLIGSFFMSVAFYPYIFILIMLTQSLKNTVTSKPN